MSASSWLENIPQQEDVLDCKYFIQKTEKFETVFNLMLFLTNVRKWIQTLKSENFDK